jgi:hypothetical protein
MGGGLFGLRLKGADGISRLLASLASDKQSPSVATLRKYAAACGKKLEIRLV